MITYDPATKTAHMNLVNLEHCGFDFEEWIGELHLAGLDENDPNIQWPDKLVVEFKEGALNIFSLDPEVIK